MVGFSVVRGTNDVYFRAKTSLPFKRVATAYCERQGLHPSTVAFRMRGKYIDDEYIDFEKTVGELGITDGMRIRAEYD